jgi:photosystem II stability/assembly factor-like uncharacterized protein
MFRKFAPIAARVESPSHARRQMWKTRAGLAAVAAVILVVALVGIWVFPLGGSLGGGSALAASDGQNGLETAAEYACSEPAGEEAEIFHCFASLGPSHFAGRVRALAVRPDNENTIWAASPGGGLWHTTDAGNSWSHSSDGFQTMIYSSLAIDPSNPNVMYAGSGEIQPSLGNLERHNLDPNGNNDGLTVGLSHRGFGILKTTDGGAHWFRLTSTLNINFFYVSRIAVSPQNSQVVLAATGTGLWESTNGGSDWAFATTIFCVKVGSCLRVPIKGIFLDVKFHSHDPSNVVATGLDGRVWFSTNGGSTFFPSALPPQPSDIPSGTHSRIELAFVRSQPDVWLAAQFFDRNTGEDPIVVLRSTDGGAHFSNWSNPVILPRLDPKVAKDKLCGNNRLHSGALFATDFGKHVFIGGTQLCQSDDGGVTFTEVFQDTIHNDYHTIVRGGIDSLGDGTIIIGNDGGVFRIKDPSRLGFFQSFDPDVVNLNNGLVNQLFYGAAINPSGIIVGGAQDIGSLHRDTNGVWTEYIGTPAGSDATTTAADPFASDLFYFGKSGARLKRRNTTQGSNICIAGADFNAALFEMADDGPSCSPRNPPGCDPLNSDPTKGPLCLALTFGTCPGQTVIQLDPSDPTANTLYVGCRQLWRTRNVKSANTSIAWQPIKAEDTSLFTTQHKRVVISAMGLRPGDPDLMYIGTWHLAEDGGTILPEAGDLWITINLDAACPQPPDLCTAIPWYRIVPSINNLPPRPVSGIAVDPRSSGVIYVSYSGWPSTNFNETPSHNLFVGVYQAVALHGLEYSFTDISAGMAPGPVYSVAVSPGGRIAAGGEFGARISNDGGSTWGLAGPRVRIAQVKWLDEHHLLVTSYGRGVYVLFL